MLEFIANWRAGCGKSASPVRREGARKTMRSPYPLSTGLFSNQRFPYFSNLIYILNHKKISKLCYFVP